MLPCFCAHVSSGKPERERIRGACMCAWVWARACLHMCYTGRVWPDSDIYTPVCTYIHTHTCEPMHTHNTVFHSVHVYVNIFTYTYIKMTHIMFHVYYISCICFISFISVIVDSKYGCGFYYCYTLDLKGIPAEQRVPPVARRATTQFCLSRLRAHIGTLL